MKMKHIIKNINTGFVKAGLLALTASTMGCSTEFAFNEISKSCEPPKSSARYGQNIGPVILSPASGQPFNARMTVSGTCADGFDVIINGSGVDGEFTTVCASGNFSTAVNFKAGDGNQEMDVSQATVEGENILDRRCFNQDSVPPQVVITGTSGAQAINTSIANLEGICESGLNVIIEGPQLVAPVTTQCSGGRFAASIEFSGPDGLKDVVARQIDLAGNNGNDDQKFLTDKTPPVVTIASPNPMSLSQGNIIISGTCEAGPRVVLQGGLLSGVVTTDCLSGNFSAAVSLSFGDGIKNVVALQTDLAGNSGSANRDFVKDATPPNVRFATPAANAISTGNMTVTGSCETGITVQLSGPGLAAATTAACAANAFSKNITLVAPDGVKNIMAQQTDIAGNIGTDTRSFIRDAAAPVVSITSPAANSVWATSLTLQGACETGLTVQISGAGVLAPSSTACAASVYSTAVTLSNGDGVKNIIVTQTDLAANVGTANRNFVRDNSRPNILITSPANNSYVGNTATISGSCETGLTVTINGAGVQTPVATACAANAFSSLVTFTAGDGNKTVSASQTDLAANTSTDSKTYIKDTTAPNVTITQPAANSVWASALTLQGACEDGLPVNISGAGIQAAVVTPCASSLYSALINLSAGDGVKNIIAQQTDAAGNMGSVNRDFMRDASAPNITITGPAVNTPAKTGLTLVGTCETGLTINLSGAGLASPATTTCAAGAYSVAITFTAGDGVKNIIASQTDLGGNTATANRNFVRDNVSPVIAITSPAAGTIAANGVTLAGTCETGLTVNLSGAGLSGPASTTCVASAFSVAIIFSAGDGVKNIIASQTDVAGNMASDNRNFVRDNIGPDIVITTPAANTVALNGVTLGGTCETGLTVNLSGAGLASPATTTCVASAFSVAILFTAGDGAKNIVASQTDLGANTSSDARSFIRDTTAPNITITAPAANTTAQTGVTLTGACETGLTVNLSGVGLSSPATTACAASAYSVAILFTAGDGVKNIIVSQTDSVGNSASANRNFNRDNTAPLLAITAPAANSYVVATAAISGTCETGLTVTLNGTGVVGSSALACNAGAFGMIVTFTAGDGAKQVVVSQTDGAGNTATDTRSFVRDTTAPAIAITAPAANTIAAAGVTLSGTCETGLTVNLSGAGLASPATTICAASAFSVAITFTAGDGPKNIIASQTDLSGNTGSDNRAFIRDSGAPALAITSPAPNSYAQNGLTLAGSCETGLTVNLSGTGLASPANTACVGSSFSVVITFTAGEGAKNIIVSQTDLALNTSTDNRSFIRDSIAPLVSINTPAANTIAQNGVTLTGVCETGIIVNLSGAGLSGPATTACIGNAYSVAITFTGGDGAKNIIATQTDLAGNIGSDNRSFIRDATAPVITIATPAANTPAQNGLTLTGTCETGLTINLSGTGLSGPATTACLANAYSVAITFTAGEGAKNIIVSQSDLAANTGSANRNFVRDTIAPALAITSPAANSEVGASGNISGTCETGLTVTLNGAGVSGSYTPACNAGVFSAVVNFTAGDGAKSVVATQTDLTGNTASSNRSFNRDTTAPIVAILTPAANSAHSATLTLTGACESGLSINISGAGVASGSSTACSAGTFSTLLTLSAGDGAKNIIATQTDLIGNSGTDNRTFIRDSTAPVVTITSPAANTAAQTGVTLAGTCETGLTVNLSGAGLSSPATTACAAGAFSVAITFTAGDGVKNIIASQTDLVGNVGSANRSFIRDNTAPAIAITSPASGTISATGVTISGTCETGLTVSISGDVNAASTTACAAGAFSAAITFSAPLGVKNITVSQTDLVGNTGSNSRSFQKLNNSTADSFVSKGPGGKVDIIFVDDNSASMEAEQTALGTKFSALTTALAGLDWQAGIITTDCTTGSVHNYCGQLFDLTGRPPGEYILSAATPSFQNVFSNTIQRPETIDCLLSGTCPSGREEGMKSTIQAMNRRDTDNAGFFRADSDLAVVYLTDEDEASNGPATATQPTAVTSAFQTIWGATKKFSSYGIIVKPGDSACYDSQRLQFGSNANYGNLISQLSTLTGGMTVSICEPDYSVTLTQIGNDVTRISKSFDLTNTPLPGTVSVGFAPAFATTFTVSGKRVTLDTVPPFGTVITFSYQY